jgi:3-deoxy-D-manno-octulosonate 8-phosphate phosphatase KdsC-like HAD superfamily phosphatase
MAAPEPGVTRLWMAVDGEPAACFDARDALRPDAAAAVVALRHAGLRVQMLTGDSAAAAAPIAQKAGIDEVKAGLDPAGKLQQIRTLQQSGLRVAMVGDGINDAAALATAEAGIAMGSGAPNSTHHAPEPGLGRRLQHHRDSPRRRCALPGLPRPAHPVGRRRSHGIQFRLCVGQQLAAAGMAAGCIRGSFLTVN